MGNDFTIDAAERFNGRAGDTRDAVCSIDDQPGLHGPVDAGTTFEPSVDVDNELNNELDRKILSYCQRFDIQTGLLNHQAIQDALVKKLKNRTAGREVALIWIEWRQEGWTSGIHARSARWRRRVTSP